MRLATIAFALAAHLPMVAGAAPAAPPAPVVELPPDKPDVIRWDPAFRTGVLPNGLRYAVMSNSHPGGGVSIRLGVDVGSVNERQDELGAAHFLEHMAFGGSHAQLQADVEKTFADAGVAFGRDRNAMTSYTETTYKIDLPHGDAAALDLGFKWLRQVADGAQLTPETMDRERGVILAERTARLSSLSAGAEQVMTFQIPSGRIGEGPGIGTKASIEALTAAQLQAFYDRWYQPQNAVVVVVGDEPVETLEARVRETFGSWRGKGPLAERPPPVDVDPARGLDALGVSIPNMPSAVGACRIGPPSTDPTGSPRRLRQDMLSQLWQTIATARLATAARTPSSGVLQGYAEVGELRGAVRISCIIGVSGGSPWTATLASLQSQIAALQAPPTEDELETAFKTVRADLRGAAAAAATRQSSDLADRALGAELEGRALPSPAEAFRVGDAAMEAVTPDEVAAAFRRDWSGAGPLVDVLGVSAPNAATIRQTWAAGASAPAKLAASAPAPVWQYASAGKRWKVAGRAAIAEGDFVRVTYANGVRLNFKHTDFEQGSVSIRTSFGDGRHGVAPSDLLTADIGAELATRGGLLKNSYADTGSLFVGYGVSVDMKMQGDRFELTARCADNSLRIDLEVMAAYLSEPGFRDLDQILTLTGRSGVGLLRAEPSAVAALALLDAVSPGAPTGLSSMGKVAALTPADLARVLAPPMTGSPIEVTVVGDVTEETATKLVGATFGSLPPRKPSTPRSDAWFLSFPEHPPALVEVTHDGPAEKAVVALAWPLYVADPARRREEYAIDLLALVYQEAILQRVRGDLGKSYSPGAQAQMSDHADQGYLLALAEVAPGDVDVVRKAMVETGARTARGDFTDQDLETVRKPLLAKLAKMLTTNDAWADVLAGSSRDGGTTVRQALRVTDDMAAVTPAEVRKAAADWMARPPIVVLVTPAKPAIAQATAP